MSCYLSTSSDKDDIFDFAMKHCCDIFLKLIYTLIELNFFCFSRSFWWVFKKLVIFIQQNKNYSIRFRVQTPKNLISNNLPQRIN